MTDAAFVADVSLVHENGDKRVRMAHFAFLGSNCVNGVSALHTELLRKTVFHELAETTETRIVNKTNGITFRRWLYEANGTLTRLLTDTLGARVLDDPSLLRGLVSLSSDPFFGGRGRRAGGGGGARRAAAGRAATG